MRNPYWNIAKYAFALVGGAGAAVTLCMGSYNLAKRAVELVRRGPPPPLAEDEEEKPEQIVSH